MSSPRLPAQFRSGYVALVGPPNVGKSTLLNRLLGRHLCAVAPRPQTTRHRILGILNGEAYQALFLDTPGLLDPKYALQRFMRREIESALSDADLVLFVADGSARDPAFDLIKGLAAPERVLLVLNKVDAVKEKQRLLGLAEQAAAAGLKRVYMVSASTGSGAEQLRDGIVAALPPGQPFYPQDAIAERPERFFAAEFIREAIFNLYGEEIPYSSTVVIDEFSERPGRKDYIRATVYVERESQKAIIIGQDGRALKRVGSGARRTIEEFLGRGVYLELWVKVSEAWRSDERFVRENIYGRDIRS